MNTNREYEQLEILELGDTYLDVVCPYCNGGGRGADENGRDCPVCGHDGALTLDLSNVTAAPVLGGCYERI